MGNLSYSDQKLALRSEPNKRKIILATSIAETSLTIEGINVVVDSGFARRTRYDPAKGLQKLVTERSSKAEAIQRSGRAGRTAPGKCYRMWSRAEEGMKPAFAPPEIVTADLAPMALQLTKWGTKPDNLALLTSPPHGAWIQAQDLLKKLGAVDGNKLSKCGANMVKLPLHARFARMLVTAGPIAAPLAALLSERDILVSHQANLSPALQAVLEPEPKCSIRDHALLKRIKIEARRLTKLAPKGVLSKHSQAQCLALAYPDRIAQRRPGIQPRYIMANGKGVVLTNDDDLANAKFLVVSDITNQRRSNDLDPKIRRALAISIAEIREIFNLEIKWLETCIWSKREARVSATRTESFGAIQFTVENWKDVPTDHVTRAMLKGIKQMGLTLPKDAQRLQSRARMMTHKTFPDISDEGLLRNLEGWLTPFISGITTKEQWSNFDPLPALKTYIGRENVFLLDKTVPAYFETPLGRRVIIDYSSETPSIELRIQELFGQNSHPLTGGKPMKVTLLSPAHRPIQITMDIPGFWKGSYADVRKDMRAKYPKHPWPEDPTKADPTLRRKPRNKYAQ